MGRTFDTGIIATRPRLARRGPKTRPWTEPWTLEGKLHLALAAVAVLGWTIAYTALTRGFDGSQDIARSQSAGTKVTASLTP